MFFILEPETVSLTGVFQRGCAINEKQSIIDVMFLAEFGENERAITFVRVGSSSVWSNSFVSGSTAAYS